ncbi:hypothetical protein NLO95_13050 [Pseudomonas syringae]|nr:hypothetical protein [Pseudomonas syringae]
MKHLAYYAGLPDSMTNKELDAEFEDLLGRLESQPVDRADVVSSLVELSNRQWHTYNVLDTGLKKRIEQYLMSIWQGHDLGAAEEVISIMLHLGLEELCKFLGSRSPQDVSSEVFNEISLALAEVGGSVLDPYSGMR